MWPRSALESSCSDFRQRLSFSYCEPGCGQQLIERKSEMVKEVDGRWGMNLKDHIAQWYLFYFLRHGLIYGFDSMPRRFIDPYGDLTTA